MCKNYPVLSEEIRDSIDYILDNFDFGKVHKVMDLLDWKWSGYDEISEGDIRAYARKQIKLCLSNMFRYGKSEFSIECGGFFVHTYNQTEDNDKVYISLRFSLDRWDNFD